MTHVVLWDPSAEDELAAVWLASPDQVLVTRAAITVDQVLTTSPDTLGDEIHGGRYDGGRVITVGPLQVTYSIAATAPVVRVHQVVDVP
jgi:hypothetical protein